MFGNFFKPFTSKPKFDLEVVSLDSYAKSRLAPRELLIWDINHEQFRIEKECNPDDIKYWDCLNEALAAIIESYPSEKKTQMFELQEERPINPDWTDLVAKHGNS